MIMLEEHALAAAVETKFLFTNATTFSLLSFIIRVVQTALAGYYLQAKLISFKKETSVLPTIVAMITSLQYLEKMCIQYRVGQ